MQEISPFGLYRPHGRNVLIVDGDERAGVALRRYLETEGWTARHVRDGRAALQLWATFTPDILVTGCEGKEIDGFELIAFARRTKEPPICVLLTRQADSRVLQPQMMRRLGVAAVVQRPCPFETIAVALEQLQPAQEPAGRARAGAPMASEQVSC